MQALAIFALFSLAAAKPSGTGVISPWGGAQISSLDLVPQPSLTVAQPLVQSAPVVHAAPAATSYSSFQRVVHPTSLAQPLIQAAPALSQPLVQTPIVSQRIVQATPVVSQPIVQAPVLSQPIVQAPIISQRLLQAAPLVSQPFVQAPIISQRLVQAAPVVSQPLIEAYAQSYAHAQPLVSTVAQLHSPLVHTETQPNYLQKLVSVNTLGHGW